MKRSTGAANTMMPLAWARPTERGLEPTSTKDVAVITSALHSSTSHHCANREANARVTSTAAAVSDTTRMKLIALT